jgi:DnaK suppressor protein
MTQKQDQESDGTLTDAQLAELRQALLGKRRELRSQLSQGVETIGAESENPPELMDQAENAVQLDDRVQRSTRESALLNEIEYALRKFESGNYGVSEESGEPIGYGRLRALPWARRTAREEEQLERR